VLTLEIPSHFPPFIFPEDRQLTNETVLLGRWLFYDQRLSKDGTRSCGICHEQQKAFTDGLIRSIGMENTPLPLNSLSLVNVAWRTELSWYNQFPDIESLMPIPLFATHPVEMGMDEELLISRLKDSRRYVDMFTNAYPTEENPISLESTIWAITDFTRTIISGDSPYDRWFQGEDSAINDEALRGMDLFFGEKMKCSTCHGGIFFDQPSIAYTQREVRHGYFNTGQYNIDDSGGYPSEAVGLIDSTQQLDDMGKFRTPTLRNLPSTYPWSHDGTHLSLDSILEAYTRGGRKIESGPHQGDGRDNPYKSELISGFDMSDSEKQDLLTFLMSLNDEGILNTPSLSTPFCVESEGEVLNEPCESPFEVN